MFRPIHLLQQFNGEDLRKYQNRWESKDGKRDYKDILEKIRKGAGEDFLQWDFEQKKYSVIDNYHDLSGFKFWNIDINFPKGDNFEAIDFSYTQGWHSTFKNAVFPSTYCAFGRFYNFTFENCLFSFSNWYGTTFEKVRFINCDFVEYDNFNNCKFLNCKFKNCFFSKNIFTDSLFDSRTNFTELRVKPSSKFKVALDQRDIPELYKGIKDGYLAGEVFDRYRHYFFKQKASETKYLKKGGSKILGWIQEVMVGYGVKPWNTILFSLLVIFVFARLYLIHYPIPDSMFMSVMAFTSLGNIPDVFPYNYFYILEAMFGIGFFALFITVLANIWFSEK